MTLSLLMLVCLVASAFGKVKSFSDPPVSPCVKVLMQADMLGKNATTSLKTAGGSCAAGTPACASDLQNTSELYDAIASVLLTNTTVCAGVTGCESDPTALSKTLGTFPLKSISTKCATKNAVCDAEIKQVALNLQLFVNDVDNDILLCCNSPACFKK